MARMYHYELDDEEIILILLRQLPPDMQQIIRFIYYEDKGFIELSQRFNICEKTMASRHRLILSWLRTWYYKFKADREKLVWELRFQGLYKQKYFYHEVSPEMYLSGGCENRSAGRSKL